MEQNKQQIKNNKNDLNIKENNNQFASELKLEKNMNNNNMQTENDKYELKKLKFHFIIKLLTITFAFLLAIALYLGFLLTNKIDLDTLLEFEWPLLVLMGITTTTLLPNKFSGSVNSLR